MYSADMLKGETPFHLDNCFTRKLPADKDITNVRRQVKGACYSYVKPKSVKSPSLVAYSREVAEILNISEKYCMSEEFVQLFSGNRLLKGMNPYAMCYGGHQFGSWAGQLGDGRAINLGEVVNQNMERWVLQLKGAGPTPYSRQADGLAVLRSSVREFLCSEAMYHLGIPTTRALSLITTGELVERDMFYDGHPQDEPGAVVCRVSPSFIRFGNFEIFSSREEYGLLKEFMDYTIETDFPDLRGEGNVLYLEWFKEVCKRTAEMVTGWMGVGFVHGVLNTDNMSILGLTIDYGPYGWIDNYDPSWTPNTTDAETRRYCFGNQPHICQWNLVQLANAIYPIIQDKEGLGDGLKCYVDTFQQGWEKLMAQKLGFLHFDAQTDEVLINEVLELVSLVETDMTIFFRNLAELERENASFFQTPLQSPLADAFYQPETLTEQYLDRMGQWMKKYRDRLEREGCDTGKKREMMNRINPKYVIRNYLAQLAIDDAEEGSYDKIRELLEVMRRPYDEQPSMEKYALKRPDWARNRPGCSMLSCSS